MSQVGTVGLLASGAQALTGLERKRLQSQLPSLGSPALQAALVTFSCIYIQRLQSPIASRGS